MLETIERYGHFMRVLLILLSLILFTGVLSGCAETQQETIIVGSMDYTEQHILGEMLVMLIEAHTDLKTILRDNMAAHVVFAAIETGNVDVYVEYTGTIYGDVFSLSGSNDAIEVYNTSVTLLAERYNIRMLDKLGFNNSFGLAVRRDTAERYGLRTYSDLAEVSSDLIFHGGPVLMTRNDGLPNLKRLYNMSFKEEVVRNDEDRYTPLMNGDVHVAEIFTTDGMLLEYDVVVLEDDKNFFPPYHGAIVARNEILDKHPELIGVLNMLTGKLPDDVMINLIHRVDVGNETPQDVARSFLRDNGLIR